MSGRNSSKIDPTLPSTGRRRRRRPERTRRSQEEHRRRSIYALTSRADRHCTRGDDAFPPKRECLLRQAFAHGAAGHCAPLSDPRMLVCAQGGRAGARGRRTHREKCTKSLFGRGAARRRGRVTAHRAWRGPLERSWHACHRAKQVVFPRRVYLGASRAVHF